MKSNSNPNQSEYKNDEPILDRKDIGLDLEACPRCGEHLDQIVWGQTNCPNCGLHFECC
jgi:uncharacterized protein (UPF0212 family)